MASNPSAFTAIQAVPWLPSDNSLLGANADILEMVNTTVLTAGTIYLAKLPVRSTSLVTNVVWAMSAAGVGASTGSFTGLYSAAGPQLSGSADVAASLTGATGQIPLALTTPQTVAGSALESAWPWAVLVVNLATTQPTMCRANGTIAAVNGSLGAANFRFGVNGTGQTALPGSITPGANTASGAIGLWVGWS
jgi:hypothetical protein